ncbi:MAG: hypothetical protein AB7N61_25290 [Acidimicrobiia bacterium]
MRPPLEVADRRHRFPGALHFVVAMAVATAIAVIGGVAAPRASAQSATDPATEPTTDPANGPITEPEVSAPASTTAAGTPTTVGAGPTTTLPCVVGVPPGYVEFVGIAGRPSQTTVQFVVTQPMTGAVQRGPLVVTLPDHAHFIDATKSYLVRAWMSDGRLVAYLTTNDCGRPRTTLADGTAVDTALLGPMLRKSALVGLGAIATLATIGLLIYLLGRIRVYGRERARIIPDTRYKDAFRPNRRRRHTAPER